MNVEFEFNLQSHCKRVLSSTYHFLNLFLILGYVFFQFSISQFWTELKYLDVNFEEFKTFCVYANFSGNNNKKQFYKMDGDENTSNTNGTTSDASLTNGDNSIPAVLQIEATSNGDAIAKGNVFFCSMFFV